MQIIKDFKEYQILDAFKGEKIENWNGYILRRPDPEIIWSSLNNKKQEVNATYNRSNKGGGEWTIYKKIPDTFTITYHDLTFNLKLMGFKHTGLFPEQAYNWCLLRDKIRSAKREVSVLNLFAYTGAATVACLKEGASVVHVDSSRGMVEWAKENVKTNHLENSNVRFIVDDCKKFVEREIRRGHKYDIILMDPPSFGRGSKHEVWDIESDLENLVKSCVSLLSDKPICFLINSYTTGLSMSVLENILKIALKDYDGECFKDELGLPIKDTNLVLPCGIFARYDFKDII